MSESDPMTSTGATSPELEQPKRYSYLGDRAAGKIEPRDDQMERLEEVTERLADGEFHVATTGRIPCGCVDGRCGCEPKPDAAGGSFTLWVMDDLVQGRYDSDTVASGYKAMLTDLKQRGVPIGGHDGPHRNDEKSDCGACDRHQEIYEFMVQNADYLRDVAASLGAETTDDTHQRITSKAAERTTFSRGAELASALTDVGGDESVDHLRGEHNEVVAVLNFRYGTTLDRDALEAEFGDNYEAFNFDVWTFEAAARAVAQDEADVQAMVQAAIYYNLATGHVLGGQTLRVVVLD